MAWLPCQVGRCYHGSMRKVYLDNNATSPVDPAVVEEMTPYFVEDFGNASSIHTFGQRARAATEEARGRVARVLGTKPGEIVFTSGGTESDNTAVRGVACQLRSRGNHIVTTQVEHPAVLSTCKSLENEGFRVTYLGVDREGRVSLSDLEQAISPETVLISVMHANNEVGSIHPIGQIGEMARSRGIVFHTDAVQSVGKIPFGVDELQIDLLSISSHKLHGPKGVGALYVRSDVPMTPLMLGGSHERRRRAGTENVPGIVGLGKAMQIAQDRMEDFNQRVQALRDRLETGILGTIPDTVVNGGTGRRMPHVSNISFLGLEGEALLIALDFQGIAVSTGAACSSGSLQPSHVLQAMHLERSRIQAAIRFSLSRMSTQEDVDYVLETLPQTVQRMRDTSLERLR